MTASARCKASLAALFTMTLVACGGSGLNSGDAPVPAPAPGTPTDEQRSTAAQETASNHALCTAIRPFYWEVGDSTASKASGSVGGNTYTATSAMAFASASKWVYAAYVMELRDGVLTDTDVKHLNFTSGYHSMGPFSCTSASTVDVCLSVAANGAYTFADDGLFFYNGGHMQRHAHDIGLGGMNSAALAVEVQAGIGDFGFTYASPQPPGGLFGTPEAYAGFLRKMLAGDLKLNAQLGTEAVCTNPDTCVTAVDTPIPREESWSYSLGHWVESDPAVGDGAFSSAGAFGFYPWIDADKRYYGIVAREQFAEGQGYASAQCGRLIRKAWATGEAQQ